MCWWEILQGNEEGKKRTTGHHWTASIPTSLFYRRGNSDTVRLRDWGDQVNAGPRLAPQAPNICAVSLSFH